jgi:uncharacterized membrane protein SirB2
MHSLLLITHSVFRYFILIFLVIFVVRTLLGWMNKSSYNNLDEKLGVWLFMVTHTQLLLGIALYFVSPAVIFSGESMKDPEARYWLVEHASMMLISIVLITVARLSTRNLTDSTLRYKKLFIYNAIALILIVVAILQSGRSFLNLPAY